MFILPSALQRKVFGEVPKKLKWLEMIFYENSNKILNHLKKYKLLGTSDQRCKLFKVRNRNRSCRAAARNPSPTLVFPSIPSSEAARDHPDPGNPPPLTRWPSPRCKLDEEEQSCGPTCSYCSPPSTTHRRTAERAMNRRRGNSLRSEPHHLRV